MSLQKPMVAQLENESKQDYLKFLVFVGMGTNRTLNKAFRQFYETTNEASRTWHTLSDKYRWTERASEYDKRSV